ncbi:hypothetical protein [Alkalihalobacillus pseudalcaliphilus]|uniref:hypothetical protein n=1 Tax=Alkalihalobacillus pseudalcaliphilus TaxID=79884 RepID=UPI00064DE73B|nr:hypothetical protein [Alkalihalobacillus pseudalcaliphilus]KMK74642.1 hypothetical protein AB990_19285 [Alkalihalobacillus pseudalcaliphilus]
MELVDCLKEHYQWQDAQFINQAILKTDQGRKRIQYWQDQDILEWQIEWRDQCSVTPHVLIDRMIRTKEEEAFIEWKTGWVTVHDDLEDYFTEKGKEEQWGTLLGAMIEHGQQTKSTVSPRVIAKQKYEDLELLLPILKSEQRELLTSCLKEVRFRLNKADQLKRLVEGIQPPLMDQVYSVRQAKKVYQVLFWNGTIEAPIRSYQGIRHLLNYWLHEHGEQSLGQVLDKMRSHEAFNEHQTMLLLAECLLPYELNRITEEIHRTDVTDHDIEQAIHFSLVEWERSKKLVSFLSRWFDQQKKVIPS